MSVSNLKLTYLDARFIFAANASFDLIKAGEHWPIQDGQIASVFSNLKDKLGIEVLGELDTRMSSQPRRERDTLRQREFQSFAPLLAQSSQTTPVRFGQLQLRRQALVITRRGTIGIIYGFKTSPTFTRSVAQTVTAFTKTRRELAAQFGQDFAIVQGALAEVSGGLEIGTELTPPLSLEFIDFDFDMGEPMSISSFLDGKRSKDLQRLCEFLRMTRAGVATNYRNSFCQEYINASLGSRDDEIWIGESRRLFRRHPESRARADVAAYWDDTVLTGLLFLGRACELEGLHQVFTNLLRDLRLEFSLPNRVPAGRMYEYLSGYERIAGEIVDPLPLERHYVHGFFRKVMREISAIVDMEAIRSSVLARSAEVRAMVDMISNYSTADATRLLAARAQRLNYAVFFFTLLISVLTVADFFSRYEAAIPQWVTEIVAPPADPAPQVVRTPAIPSNPAAKSP